MHYICKGESPDFFESEKLKQSFIDDPAWNNLHCRTELRSHLIDEQQQLCIYCERRIPIDAQNSHVEHILSQTDNSKLKFDYDNLVASCNGDQCHPMVKDQYQPENIQSCGHKKADNFDADTFLNPVKELHIEQYFTYNKISCAICSSGKNDNKAKATIELLNLDNARLNNERANARTALNKVLKRSENLNHRKLILRSLLAKKEHAFISFLRNYFKAVIG